MATKPPPVACNACGTVVDGAIAVEFWQDAVQDAAVQRREKRKLQAQRDRNPRAHPKYEEAMDVLRYWRDTCHPGAKELENERLKLCLERLDAGHSAEMLKRACYGYSLKPFVVNGRRSHAGPRDDWRADAALIFRDEQHVKWGLDIADRAVELTAAFGSNENGSAPKPPTPPPGQLSKLGEAALRIALALPVFPIQPRDKQPVTRHGVKDAKQNPDAIRTFWAKYPDANIAIPTGRVTGLVVLDVDGDDGYESLHRLEDKHELLPDTKSVKTPRGGSHLFFQHPGLKEIRNSASLLGEALDVRGDGGYVLVPPSVGATGREYVTDEEAPVMPMPPWLVDLIHTRQLHLSTALAKGDFRALFTGTGPGQRNDRLFKLACSLVHRLDPTTASGLVHAANATYAKPPLPDREVDQLIKSALRYKERE